MKYGVVQPERRAVRGSLCHVNLVAHSVYFKFIMVNYSSVSFVFLFFLTIYITLENIVMYE